jgi:hypothetical protein
MNKNYLLAMAAIAGSLIGFGTRYRVEAPFTATWRRQQCEASVNRPLSTVETTAASPTAVQ